MALEVFKVWLFYLIEDGSLYAYTSEKSYAKTFRKQRKMSLFYEKEIMLTEEEYRFFNYLHNRQMLFSNPLSDGKYDYYFLTTYEEDSEIEAATVEIEDGLTYLEKVLLPIPFEPKLHDSLVSLRKLRKEEESGGLKGHFNTLAIFFSLYGMLLSVQKK